MRPPSLRIRRHRSTSSNQAGKIFIKPVDGLQCIPGEHQAGSRRLIYIHFGCAGTAIIWTGPWIGWPDFINKKHFSRNTPDAGQSAYVVAGLRGTGRTDKLSAKLPNPRSAACTCLNKINGFGKAFRIRIQKQNPVPCACSPANIALRRHIPCFWCCEKSAARPVFSLAKRRLKSEEALSTMTICEPGAFFNRDRTHFSTSGPEFQLTITIETTAKSVRNAGWRFQVSMTCNLQLATGIPYRF